jgi:hypothetical protein
MAKPYLIPDPSVPVVTTGNSSGRAKPESTSAIAIVAAASGLWANSIHAAAS